jgi:hypothetical protein
MRLIDADVLKKAMDKKALDLANGGMIFIESIKHIIDNAPTVETDIEVATKDAYEHGYTDGWKERFGEPDERPQGEWIPVSERLPEQSNQSYLVTVDYGEGIICSCQRFFFNEDLGWNDDCVIAWQPLPEPYKKGGAE